ncbi:hypothetical protein JQK15_13455 [Sphingobium sp. BHU LFT2]|uniref:hypothetical protein n=1 Tax=Sphingobium sp. BHU LFT2 TaxID=2807634 RepID=UPI001BE7007B|nr:hypothetical protein [Sphingobium sp. BHU LFT2]MBT2244545.1 hypothetical protein [Sphingobium sp. BHU LFT2]
MTTIYYDDRPCGSGKTYTECNFMVRTPGLYLLAVEQRTVMVERLKMLAELAADAGTTPVIKTIFSSQAEVREDGRLDRVGVANVRVEIEALPSTYQRGHMIIIITHEGLKSADLAAFEGWNLYIDETPTIWDKQLLSTSVTKDFFARHYDLMPTENDRVRRITAVSDSTAKDFARDDLAKAVGVFHARVLSDRIEVATKLARWSELNEDANWTWWSIWSPEQLGVFQRVTILANAFTRSVTYRIMSAKWPEIEWVRLDRSMTRPYAQRRVVINYFARAHTAQRMLWNSERGKGHLRQVARHIDAQVDPMRHIWMCNGDDEATLTTQGVNIAGVKLSPRQQGSNRFMAATTATMIYTSKPDTSDRLVMRMIGVDPDAVIETREYEVLVQFACRTSIRDAASTETVNLWVYDEVQAKHLEAYFQSTGYCIPSLALHDLGWADWKPAKKEPPVLSPDEIQAKKDHERALDTARKARKRAEQKAAKQKEIEKID